MMNAGTRSACIVAIDFGTAGTGFAFSMKRNDFVHDGMTV
jgi:RNase H-fold protein (predicted Holliday junction resolvase)